MDNIQWKIFALDMLPAALFGYSQFSGSGSQYIHRIRLEENNIAIGFADNSRDATYNPPLVIVVGDHGSAEVFSWLKVYAPETSPLSQFARVLSISDWDAFQDQTISSNFFSKRGDQWACIILGEVLAQGEGDVDLNTLPLSRAAACFSAAMARTSMIHGHENAIHTCIDRLVLLEADQRFVRRSVTIEDLLPIWTIIGSQLNESPTIEFVAELVVEAAKQHGRGSGKSTINVATPSLHNYPDLLSDSIENRTVSFKRLATDIMLSFGDTRASSHTSALLAAGAFLVGRGTTHAFLLRPLAKRMPAVFTWFGLIAALAGSRVWDVSWSRATKGIERLLRAKFDWTDPPSTDICWSEYYWLARTFDGVETFSELPKMLPKVLSIEVVPGAACQFRLTTAQGGISPESDQKIGYESAQRNENLQAALMQFVNLAMNTKQLLEPQAGQSYPTQQTLGLGDKVQSSPKNSRSKRTK